MNPQVYDCEMLGPGKKLDQDTYLATVKYCNEQQSIFQPFYTVGLVLLFLVGLFWLTDRVKWRNWARD
jgi:hypothetical protein